MLKKVILLVLFACAFLLLNHFHILDILRPENMDILKEQIDSFGMLAPGIFIISFIVATLLFLPGLPLTLLAGVLFGAFWGGVYVVIGSTIGVSLSFLVGRYLGRDFVRALTLKNEKLANLDQYIKARGDTILIISRLVPIFPFNLQNYAYGITDIKFSTYFWYSLIFMLPGTFIYTAFGALAYSKMPVEQMVFYSGILLVILCLLIVVPKRLFKISAKDL